MSKHAFFVTGSRAVFVANDAVGLRRLQADEHTIPAQMQLPLRVRPTETLYYISEGAFEFMVSGATGYVATGSFVRVPAGTAHSCRNVGDRPGKLLQRALSSSDTGLPPALLIEVSAA